MSLIKKPYQKLSRDTHAGDVDQLLMRTKAYLCLVWNLIISSQEPALSYNKYGQQQEGK